MVWADNTERNVFSEVPLVFEILGFRFFKLCWVNTERNVFLEGSSFLYFQISVFRFFKKYLYFFFGVLSRLFGLVTFGHDSF